MTGIRRAKICEPSNGQSGKANQSPMTIPRFGGCVQAFSGEFGGVIYHSVYHILFCIDVDR